MIFGLGLACVTRALRTAGLIGPAGVAMGRCKGCRTMVRSTDDYRGVPGGIAHRECSEFMRGYPRGGWA